jgi:hypothetical protein
MRLLKWCLLLCCVFTIGIGITLLLGRQQPVPANIAALQLDACELPCWIGIVPGESLVGDAKTQIQQVFGNQPDYQILEHNQFSIDILNTVSGDLINIYIGPVTRDDFDRSIVYVLTILFRPSANFDTSLIAGEVFNLIGHPTSIGQSPTMNASAPVLFLKSNRVVLYLEEYFSICRKISITDSVNFLYLSSEPPSDEVLAALFQKRWAGFKSCYDFR